MERSTTFVSPERASSWHWRGATANTHTNIRFNASTYFLLSFGHKTRPRNEPTLGWIASRVMMPVHSLEHRGPTLLDGLSCEAETIFVDFQVCR